MATPEDFQENVWNRFEEMENHIDYSYNRHGSARIPKSFRLEVCTRKRDVKFAFKETIDVLPSLRAYITSGQKFHSTLQNPWEALYEEFLKKIKETCKIDIFAVNRNLACKAVRKVSAINLVAAFAQEENFKVCF